jgi:hypothetical protein
LTDPEGSIDVQWITGIGQGVPTTYWSTAGGRYGHEPFLDWLVDLANASAPPLTQSLSYGENEGSYSEEYEGRVNAELLKLGLRGLSIFVATGDTGVQGAAQPGGAPPQCAPFVPTFPATSPFVTAVGGSQFSDHTTEVCNAAEVPPARFELAISWARAPSLLTRRVEFASRCRSTRWARSRPRRSRAPRRTWARSSARRRPAR